MAVLCQPFQHLVSEGNRVVVFMGGCVQLPVVNTHTPPCNCSSWDQLIFLIFNNSHTSLFRDNLYWGYPLVIRDRVDNPSIQQLKNFLFHTLIRIEIESSLSLYGRSAIRLHIYTLSDNRQTHTLNIVKCVPNGFSMLFNQVDQSVQIISIYFTSDNNRVCRIITQRSIL